jgi:hypothetical protein
MKRCKKKCYVVGMKEGKDVRVIKVEMLWIMDLLLELCNGVKDEKVKGKMEYIVVLRSYANGYFKKVVYNIK